MTANDDLKGINETENTVDSNSQLIENKPAENNLNLSEDEVAADEVITAPKKRRTKLNLKMIL